MVPVVPPPPPTPNNLIQGGSLTSTFVMSFLPKLKDVEIFTYTNLVVSPGYSLLSDSKKKCRVQGFTCFESVAKFIFLAH